MVIISPLLTSENTQRGLHNMGILCINSVHQPENY
jgi:hypothetical protein